MTIANEQTTSRMSQLLEQVRLYFTLQKNYLSLHGVEILTRLFSAIALAAILILVGFLVILFGSFALAYWIGELLNSQILGFAIIAGVLLLTAMLIWANRMAWIVMPTVHFMIGLLATEVVQPTLEGVVAEKKKLEEQLAESQLQMKDNAHQLLAPQPAARDRWDYAMNLLHNGWTIFRGVQLGLSFVEATRQIFGLGQKRRRK